MNKLEKEYSKLYGDISYDYMERIDSIIPHITKRNKLKVFDEIKRILNIKWKKLDFTIFILPKGTPRPRSGKFGFYVKGASDHKKFFREFTKNKELPIISTPTRFYATVYLPIPNSMNPVEKILCEMGFGSPIAKPDWDNLAKTYCDMIQDIILDDDSLIVKGVLEKRYSLKPRIEIHIEYMEDFDINFNKKKIQRKWEK